MKKILIYFIFLFLSTQITSADNWIIKKKIGEDTPTKMLIYGHVYLQDKNHPLKNMKIYIKKDEIILSNWKSDASGLYQIVNNNRSDYLNLCLESTNFSEIQNVSFCSTVKVFQKIWQMIDGVDVRELEYDFYTNNKWENLNELYEKEITNSNMEQSYSQYEENVQKLKEEEKRRQEEDSLTKKRDEEKAKYKMPANTEMTWPLKSMQVIWVITNNLKTWSWSKIDTERVSLQVYAHNGILLKDEKLSDLSDFNFVIEPRQDPVFLSPATLKIESSEYTNVNWENRSKYQTLYFSLNKEKNIINAKLPNASYWFMERTITRKEPFPVLWIILIVSCLFIWWRLILENSRKNKYNDFNY